MKKTVIWLTLLLMASTANACRFWIGVGENVQDEVVSQLIIMPNSLKTLGDEYHDGWSVGYYDQDGHLSVSRGAYASNIDPEFDNSIYEFSETPVSIAFSHLRRASSGCVEGVVNPHPFIRKKDGVTWIFGHNGGINKRILIDRIGKAYLDEHPPETCTDNPPTTWIDSELYFIFLLKSIEESGGDVSRGIELALSRLFETIEEDDRYLNFFLSNGQAVWVFRKGNSLFYLEDKENGRNYVASTIPEFTPGEWKEFPEYVLGKLVPGQDPILKEINSDVHAP